MHVYDTLQTKFHEPNSKGSLDNASKPTAADGFYATTTLI
jgi:hypothetical protein